MIINLLVGCQTTGNPREGGLFGWSEEKARERQVILETETNAARRTADFELQRGQQLSKQQSQLHTEVNQLQADLARLISENDQLDRQIRALMSTRKVSNAELSRLRQTLAANKRALATARLAASREPSDRTLSQISSQSDTVTQYNRQLQREVLLLMGR